MKKFILTTVLLFCVCLVAAAQSFLVKGEVSDANGDPLPGVTVIVEETKDGVVTDYDGFFTIQCKLGDHLRFSGVGYYIQVLEINSTNARDLIKITMKDENPIIVTPSSYGYAHVDSQKSSAVIFRKREIV